MKQAAIIIVASLIHSLNSFSQTPTFTKVWEKVYGGTRREVNYSKPKFYLTPDSNLLYIADFAESNASGNKMVPNCGGETAEGDIWVLKLDQQGNKIWEKTLGGTDMEWANAALMETDGSVVIGGHSKSNVACEKSQNRYDPDGDYWVIKIDSAGNKIWDKRFGWNYYEEIRDIVKTDEGYLLAGNAAYPGGYQGGDVADSSHGPYDNFWIVKIDSIGNKLSDKFYGGYLYTDIMVAKRGVDGSYFSGSTSEINATWDISTPTFGGTLDGWILKVDSLGNKLWDLRLGGNKWDGINECLINSNAELVVCLQTSGNSANGNINDTVSRGLSDFILYKIGSDSGNIIMQRRMGSNKDDNIIKAVQMPDNGYMLLCRSSSDSAYDKSENSKGNEDFWFVRTDSMFNVMWDKTIGGNSYEGYPAIVFLDDSNFVIAGQSASDVSGDKTLPLFDTINSGVSAGDIWIMKYTIGTQTAVAEQTAISNFSVYPNPVLSYMHIQLPYSAMKLKSTVAVITNVAGRMVYKNEFDISQHNEIDINVSSIPAGIYFIRIGNAVKKCVKM